MFRRRIVKSLLVAVGVVFLVVAVLATVYRQPDRPVAWLATRWATPPSEFVEVAGMPVHLRDVGWLDDPSPLVLLHGTGSSLHTWEGWTESLVQNRRVISFDLPGFGLTGPHPRNDYSIGAYVDFVIATLDEIGVDRFTVGGNSLGGHIAWATAVEFPQRVDALILVDSAGYGVRPDSVPMGLRMARTPILRSVIQEVLPRSVVRGSVENVFGDPSLVTEELVDRYFELTLRNGNREALGYRMEQQGAMDMRNLIPGIQQPTLILWGEKDRLIPLEAAHRFDEAIADSRLITWPELGHVPHEEAPKLTVVPVIAFLESVAESRSDFAEPDTGNEAEGRPSERTDDAITAERT